MKNQKPSILAISGAKNTGKTTLIEALIPRLAAAGLRVAVIKHDGHCFAPDTPGTDTHRFFEAGASGTAIFDGEKYMLTKRENVGENPLIAMFPDADLILLEGFKQSLYPKIELLRKGFSEVPVCNPDTLVAHVSNFGVPSHVPVFSPDHPDSIADFILSFHFANTAAALKVLASVG